MTELETARAYLEQDVVHYVNMLDILNQGNGNLLYAGEDGVLLYDRGSTFHMMSARDAVAAHNLLNLLPKGCDLLTGHETFYFLDAVKTLHRGEALLCYSALYEKTEPVPIPQTKYKLCKLEQAHATYVFKHYSHSPGGIDYVEGAIRRGMIGAFLDGVLAGFVGFHCEGSIGLLEVLPAYRKQGIGAVLEAAAINLALQQGRYPFGQIIEGNDASLALQHKLGLTVSKRHMFWLY